MDKCLWRDIPGYNGKYRVSTNGDVISLARKNIGWYKLKQRIDNNGYLYVILYYHKKRKQINIHRLVGEAFLGPIPKNYETRHLDGNKLHNALSNLRYGTPYENAQDRILHEKTIAGSKSPRSKLTEEDVDDIIELIENGVSIINIATKFHVHKTTISKIKCNKNWKHKVKDMISARKGKSIDLNDAKK